jgi:hypothetical protein
MMGEEHLAIDASGQSRITDLRRERTERANFFVVLFHVWGWAGLLVGLVSVVGAASTVSVGVGTSAYVTMGLTFWIGGMVLFGLSALLSGQTYIAQYSMRPSAPISTNPEYPEMHKGLPYRRNDDGSVAVLTANGPHTYKSWREFWDAMERM